jgi:putative DNA primase/helicase
MQHQKLANGAAGKDARPAYIGMDSATPHHLDAAAVREAMRGHWPSTLPALGIEAAFLTGRHGPCPGCGGRDRFRFDDRDGLGGFICGRGGDPLAGDGFALLEHVHGWGFSEALAAVAGLLGMSGSFARPSRRTPHNAPAVADEVERERSRQALRRQFKEAAPLAADSPAVRYLEARKLVLTAYPAVLRDELATYWAPAEPKPLELGRCPAMVAAIQGPAGQLVGLHRTYLAGGSKARFTHPQTGEALPAKKMRAAWPGATKGAAVRLHAAGEHLVIGEGIETALAAHIATGRPAWAALSAGGLARLILPDTVQDVLIAADADPAGEQAARALAARLIAQGRTARIAAPAAGDWADALAEVAHV